MATLDNNFYGYFSRHISEDLNAFSFAHTIEPDDPQKTDLVIKFKEPLSGEALQYAEECLNTVAYWGMRDLDLLARPSFMFVDPSTATFQKAFDMSDFKPDY